MDGVRDRVLRWRRLLLLVCTGGLALAGSLPLAAQEEQRADPRLEVVLAVLPQVRGTLPEGPSVLDPGELCTARLFGLDCPPALRSAADRLGLRLNSREFTHVCLGGPASCRLVGAESLIVPSQVEVRGTTASVILDVWWRTGSRTQPVGHHRSRVTLAREGGRWRITRSDPRVPRQP